MQTHRRTIRDLRVTISWRAKDNETPFIVETIGRIDDRIKHGGQQTIVLDGPKRGREAAQYIITFDRP